MSLQLQPKIPEDFPGNYEIQQFFKSTLFRDNARSVWHLC